MLDQIIIPECVAATTLNIGEDGLLRGSDLFFALLTKTIEEVLQSGRAFSTKNL